LSNGKQIQLILKQPPDRITDLVLESSTGDEPMNLYSRLTWTAPSASPETPNATGKQFYLNFLKYVAFLPYFQY